MKIELLGKFYDNHSLSIVNRNIALSLKSLGADIQINALDSYDPEYNVDKDQIRILHDLETDGSNVPDIQIRHTYPPIWSWPEDSKTKVVFIQPWEFTKVPFEWQYKFETFADALLVPSKFCRSVFINGGIKPEKIYTIPNGYNDKIFNKEPAEESVLTDKSNKFTFMYVGNAQWRKGLEILLNTWGRAFSKFDNVRLLIKDNPSVYGKNNLLNEIIKLQYITNCAEIVYIDDNLSDKQIASLYKSSNVIVHPYRAEGFGMHIQEAMACGCFPIVSANGPTDDFVPDTNTAKIQTATKVMNITDPSIFAMKSGDSSTLMGSHTFYNEPIPESLLQNMLKIYSSHNREALYEHVEKLSNLTTWEQAGQLVLEALEQINKKDTHRR